MVEECKELRCEGCGKLLAEKATPGTVIVCSRCKARNERAVAPSTTLPQTPQP